MGAHSSILCPIDFSDASRGALRHAALIAEQCHSQLVVATVDDPLLASMDVEPAAMRLTERTRLELEHTVAETLGDRFKRLEVAYEVAVGRPADEILHLARQHRSDLIVMSSHGLTGMRKLFFGSTTERVLRDAAVPVLVTSADRGPAQMADVRAVVNRIVVPVDLTSSAPAHMHVAARVAEALEVPLLVTHVIEPTRLPFSRRAHAMVLDAERRARAEEALEALVKAVPAHQHAETLIAYGDPAEEIAKVARDRNAHLIVIGLRSGEGLRGRMGSVTYRVLCVAHALVLAIPPAPVSSDSTSADRAGAATPDIVAHLRHGAFLASNRDQ
jgi:nucleotide-binding universal stress UspA family protein